MRARGTHTYEAYAALLSRDVEEYDRLLDALTINVTKFFRNVELWERLGAEVIPDLWQAGSRPLRVWSAGCASGEEPYSLAMLFADVAVRAGHPEWMHRLVIDATDIDRQCLERARIGNYPPAVFSETPPGFVARFTEPGADGGRLVTDDIRRVVRVSRLDLTRDPPRQPPYDMVVCRNVLIYFDRLMQERLFAVFAGALRPGGYLVLGKVETILGPMRDQLELVDARERVYRRPR
jgi:chemotaxis methyl-accepting protein methylase